MVLNDKVSFEIDGVRYEAKVSIKYHGEIFGQDTDNNRGNGIEVIDEVVINGVINDQGLLITPTDEMIEIINGKAMEKI